MMASDGWNDASDADRPSPTDFFPDASGAKPPGSRSKASIRASLACVQCRSKQYVYFIHSESTGPHHSSMRYLFKYCHREAILPRYLHCLFPRLCNGY